MSCQIIYNNQKYSIESFKDFLDNNKNIFLQDFISQDIEGFKEFVNGEPIIEPIISKKINDIYSKYSITKQEWLSLSAKEKDALIWQYKNCK